MSDDDKISLDELTDMAEQEVGGKEAKPGPPPATDGGSDKLPATSLDAFAKAWQLLINKTSPEDATARRAFQNEMSPLLTTISSSVIAATAFAEQVKRGVADKTVRPAVAVFALSGLAARSTTEARALFSAKKIDFPNLGDQCKQFLIGAIEWREVVPQPRAVATAAPAPTPPTPTPVPTPDPPVTRVDPGLITAQELAARLKITVVDVLAFAGLTEGDGSTIVSSMAVMAAIAASKVQPADAEPPKADDDKDDLVTVDRTDPLSDFKDDWFVRSCKELIQTINE